MDDDQVIEFGRVISVAASTSTRATTIQLAGVGAEGADDSAERGDAVEVMQPAGLMAAPSITSTTEACFVRHGDRQVALGLLDKGAPAQDVEAGETRVYAVGGSNAQTVIRLRANGDIEITAGASQNVILNGGTLKVARATDPVTVTLTALQIGTIIAPAGGGPCTGGPISITGTIDSGAGNPRVKA
jgi:hypothetical protein